MSDLGFEHMVIIGFGWVGQANALALRRLGFEVSYVDPTPPKHHYPEYEMLYDSIPRVENLARIDSNETWYIVCVGDRVSDDGAQDISSIREALTSLVWVKGGVILRSTVLPDSLKDLSFDYYMPEFLHEKKAVEECVSPYLFVLGTKRKRATEPRVFSIWRNSARKTFEGTPREASFIKYLSNLWNALRIAFVNEFGNTIGKPKDRARISEIERIIDFLFDHRGYLRYGRSFGGHCLPKDTRAFLTWYQKNARLPLIAGMYESNALHKEMGEKFPLLPEWYSEWQERHMSGWRALQEFFYAIQKNMRPKILWSRLVKKRNAEMP